MDSGTADCTEDADKFISSAFSAPSAVRPIRDIIKVTTYDAIIVGAGPAGSACAAHLASTGRRVLLLDKSKFPRDKVCGDCVNPSAWPVLDRLGLRERIHALRPTIVRQVEFFGAFGKPLIFRVPESANPEFVIRRRDLDQLLVDRAIECGADFLDGTTATAVESGWSVRTTAGAFAAPILIAADGRNSTVARLAGRLAPPRRERVAIQCHCPLVTDLGSAVRLIFHAGGYGGLARVNEKEINLCLVARAEGVAELRAYAEQELGVPPETPWQSIAPLSRADAADVARDGLFLLGDAARVVEPFTGEGIYYAMRSGELAAQALNSHPLGDAQILYRREQRRMVRGRLWINRTARLAAANPVITSHALRFLHRFPAPLHALTKKVVAGTP